MSNLEIVLMILGVIIILIVINKIVNYQVDKEEDNKREKRNERISVCLLEKDVNELQKMVNLLFSYLNVKVAPMEVETKITDTKLVKVKKGKSNGKKR